MAPRTKKITLNVPVELLQDAQEITGQGVTATINEGLLELQRKKLRAELLRFKGKLKIELDLEKTRK